MRLTKRAADAAKPANADVSLWDSGPGSVPGFGLRVRAGSGSKTFVFVYRNRYGKSKRLTVGRYGALTIEQARAIAKQAAAVVAAGGDPSASKQRDRKALTVNELLSEYLQSGAFASKAATTRAVDKGRIERHLRPLLGGRIVETLKPEDIRRAFAGIRDGKTAARVKTGARGLAKVRGGEGAARMAIRVLRAIFSWAMREGLAADNPCMRVQLGADGVRTAIINDAKGYQRLFKTLDKLESHRRIRSPVADCIRVLALTGARRNEIAAARWEWLDAKRGALVLPASAHKTGKRTGAKTIALPAAALAVINRQPEGKPADFIFAPAGGRGPLSLTKPWQLVRKEAGLPDDLTLHCLRHSFATQLAAQGASAAQLMGALGHAQLGTTSRYLKTIDDARRQVVETYGAGIAAALNDGKSGEVLPMRKGAE